MLTYGDGVADINIDDYTIDVADVEKKITDKTKAVIPVHLYGHPSNLDKLNTIAKANSIKIIEDACQSLGSLYNEKQTGTIGDLG